MKKTKCPAYWKQSSKTPIDKKGDKTAINMLLQLVSLPKKKIFCCLSIAFEKLRFNKFYEHVKETVLHCQFVFWPQRLAII